MKHRFIYMLRFLLILPVAVVSWLLIFFMGLLVERFANSYLCPSGFDHGAKCSSPYSHDVTFGLMVVFAGLSAIAVVTTALVVAPSHKFRCGVVVYLLGASVATLLALPDWLPWISTILSGLLPLLALKRFETNKRASFL